MLEPLAHYLKKDDSPIVVEDDIGLALATANINGTFLMEETTETLSNVFENAEFNFAGKLDEGEDLMEYVEALTADVDEYDAGFLVAIASPTFSDLGDVWKKIKQNNIAKAVGSAGDFLKSTFRFIEWCLSTVERLSKTNADTEGKPANKILEAPGLAKYFQYVPGTVEDPSSVLSKHNSYLKYVLGSKGLYEASEAYLEAVVDQLSLINDEGEIEDKAKFKEIPLKAYRSIVDSLRDFYGATHKVNDTRFGRGRLSYRSDALPLNRAIFLPVHRDVAVKFEIPRGRIGTIDEKASKEFATQIAALNSNQVDKLLGEIKSLAKTLEDVDKFLKYQENIMKAYDDAVKKAEELLHSQGKSKEAVALAKKLLKNGRSDSTTMTKGVMQLSELTTGLLKASVTLCERSINNLD